MSTIEKFKSKPITRAANTQKITRFSLFEIVDTMSLNFTKIYSKFASITNLLYHESNYF